MGEMADETECGEGSGQEYKFGGRHVHGCMQCKVHGMGDHEAKELTIVWIEVLVVEVRACCKTYVMVYESAMQFAIRRGLDHAFTKKGSHAICSFTCRNRLS